jgi:hypothetical protein
LAKTIKHGACFSRDFRNGTWKLYQIERQAITPGLRGADVRVERRLDGSLAVRHAERYVPIQECAVADRPKVTGPKPKPATRSRTRRRGSDWNKDFDLQKAPKVWQAAQRSGYPPQEERE